LRKSPPLKKRERAASNRFLHTCYFTQFRSKVYGEIHRPDMHGQRRPTSPIRWHSWKSFGEPTIFFVKRKLYRNWVNKEFGFTYS
jgi:hypothetical protein